MNPLFDTLADSSDPRAVVIVFSYSYEDFIFEETTRFGFDRSLRRNNACGVAVQKPCLATETRQLGAM